MVKLVGISLKILKKSVSFIIMNHGSTLLERKRRRFRWQLKVQVIDMETLRVQIIKEKQLNILTMLGLKLLIEAD